MKKNFTYKEKIAHLSEKQISELMAKYYAGAKNTFLIDEYNINIKPNDIYKVFPLKITSFDCPYCKTNPLKIQPLSRSSYSPEIAFCEICGHEHNTNCRCNNCKHEREVEKQNNIIKIQNFIYEQYEEDLQEQYIFEELTVQERLYAAALLRTCLSEDMTIIKSLRQTSSRLAPTVEYTYKIIKELRAKRIIAFSPDADYDSVTIENNRISAYYIDRMSWHLNVCSEYMSEDEILKELTYPTNFDMEIENVCELWQEVAFYEALEYLEARLTEYKLPTDVLGEKTFSAIQMALRFYSTSQVFNIIWSAAKSAAAYYQKERITKNQAVTSIAGAITRHVERSIADRWDIRGYDRNYNQPQTPISSILYDKMLRIGEAGFRLIPSVDNLHVHTHLHIRL